MEVRTIGEMFLKLFPQCDKVEDGVPDVCPNIFEPNVCTCLSDKCAECMRKFWKEPLREETQENKRGFCIDDGYNFAKCSVCGEIFDAGTEGVEAFGLCYKYCPDCGAVMGKEGQGNG